MLYRDNHAVQQERGLGVYGLSPERPGHILDPSFTLNIHQGFFSTMNQCLKALTPLYKYVR